MRQCMPKAEGEGGSGAEGGRIELGRASKHVGSSDADTWTRDVDDEVEHAPNGGAHAECRPHTIPEVQ